MQTECLLFITYSRNSLHPDPHLELKVDSAFLSAPPNTTQNQGNDGFDFGPGSVKPKSTGAGIELSYHVDTSSGTGAQTASIERFGSYCCRLHQGEFSLAPADVDLVIGTNGGLLINSSATEANQPIALGKGWFKIVPSSEQWKIEFYHLGSDELVDTHTIQQAGNYNIWPVFGKLDVTPWSLISFEGKEIKIEGSTAEIGTEVASAYPNCNLSVKKPASDFVVVLNMFGGQTKHQINLGSNPEGDFKAIFRKNSGFQVTAL